MSAETTTETPKKSILTRAMEAVRVNEDYVCVAPDGTVTEPKKPNYRRFAIGAGAVVGVAAVVVTAAKLLGKSEDDINESTDETPED